MNLALYCLVRKMPFDPSLRCIALPHGFRWCWCWCHRPPPSIPVTAAPPFSPISVPRADLRTDRAAGPPAHPAPTLVVYPSGPHPPPSSLPPSCLPPLARDWRTAAAFWRSITPCAAAEGLRAEPHRSSAPSPPFTGGFSMYGCAAERDAVGWPKAVRGDREI